METSKSRIGFAYALLIVIALAGLTGCAGFPTIAECRLATGSVCREGIGPGAGQYYYSDTGNAAADMAIAFARGYNDAAGPRGMVYQESGNKFLDGFRRGRGDVVVAAPRPRPVRLSCHNNGYGNVTCTQF